MAKNLKKIEKEIKQKFKQWRYTACVALNVKTPPQFTTKCGGANYTLN
jgi:hypothetical protein